MIEIGRGGYSGTFHADPGILRSHRLLTGDETLRWKDIIRNLSLVGYDGVISIE
ncbi:MAG TPA: hypothetical protein PLE10_00935 [Brevefilum sp.]|nr:hypothetical protein [Brevefilum sp.]HOR18382.1 hypothetical protein [Brevefilum sp.]